jgi:1,4-alpha-glucan branching enzyme
MLRKEFAGNSCKVTFILPESIAKNAVDVYLVGAFTKWNTSPLRMLKVGDSFEVAVELPIDQEYTFKYIVDNNWLIDLNADKYRPNPFTGDDSVVMTYTDHNNS